MRTFKTALALLFLALTSTASLASSVGGGAINRHSEVDVKVLMYLRFET